MRRTRIAVLNSHPIQYFAPLYAYLNAAEDLEITALYLSDISIRGGKDTGFGQDVKWDVDLLAGYQSVFLGAAAKTRVPAGFFSLIAPQVWSEVRSGRYDALLLHGHNHAANHIALAAAKSIGMPVMMRGETHLGLTRGGIKARLRRPLMGGFYGLFDAMLAIGSANAAFYRSMGVPEHKIFLVPYAVDNDRFRAASRLTEAERADVRTTHSIPPDIPAILYAAKFIPRKRPGDLLEAAHRLRRMSDQPFSLVMAGSGELEGTLRAVCADHGLDNVVFTGFVNQVELPRLYGACDVFVLPSQDEPWGLAVNEAMCAGLPIVISEEIGCVPDLIIDGENGFTFPAGDTDALAAALRRLVDDAGLRQRQSQASRDRIARWSYANCLSGLHAAIESLSIGPALHRSDLHPGDRKIPNG